MLGLLAIGLGACSNAAEIHVDAAFVPLDAAADTSLGDIPASLQLLVVNEVAAGDTPDWFEVVNASFQPLQLDDYVFVDAAGDFTKAKPFPMMTLGPGAYYVQNVDDASAGFKLSSDEEIWVYRASDHALSDGVDWPEGAAPAGMSYARSPTIFGPFVTGSQTPGSATP
jgi:hypothetical protein